MANLTQHEQRWLAEKCGAKKVGSNPSTQCTYWDTPWNGLFTQRFGNGTYPKPPLEVVLDTLYEINEKKEQEWWLGKGFLIRAWLTKAEPGNWYNAAANPLYDQRKKIRRIGNPSRRASHF